MASKPRLEFAPGRHHVYARGNDRMAIYQDDVDRLAWLRLLAEIAKRLAWRCEAWTLMTNHFHLLVETTEPNLGAGMQLLNGRYARGFNLRHGRVNHLFGDRYGSTLVENDAQCLTVVRYIPLNAVIAGLCDRPEEWPWCSYGATIGLGPAPSFLCTDAILALFGRGETGRRRYAEFVEAELDPRVTLRGGAAASALPVTVTGTWT
jgi:putative transposase